MVKDTSIISLELYLGGLLWLGNSKYRIRYVKYFVSARFSELDLYNLTAVIQEVANLNVKMYKLQKRGGISANAGTFRMHL